MSVNKNFDASANIIMDMVLNKYILFRNGVAYCENGIYVMEDVENGCVILIKANSEKEAKVKYYHMRLNTKEDE
jgi:hypothetical protein